MKRRLNNDSAEDHVLLLHKLGFMNILDGVTYDEAISYLNKKGVIASSRSGNSQINRAFSDVFRDPQDRAHPIDQHNPHFMTSEAYYRHLEYIELSEARQNAKSANRNALIALGVSIGLALIQIFIELNQ